MGWVLATHVTKSQCTSRPYRSEPGLLGLEKAALEINADY